MSAKWEKKFQNFGVMKIEVEVKTVNKQMGTHH